MEDEKCEKARLYQDKDDQHIAIGSFLPYDMISWSDGDV